MGASVLDAGCGAGLFLGLLADTGQIYSGFGFDSSNDAVAFARQMTKKLSGSARVEVRQIDATAPWPADTYDVVSLIDVLHHVPPAFHTTVLNRAVGCVKVGGLFLYKDMATRPKWQALCNQAHDLVLARQWIHHVEIERVDTWASLRGLEKNAEGTASRYCYAHEWRLYRKNR
jgi:2-polyprenyl-3-methyl-5-hydroxy-6-metoxy-1,4-benzoquinol methylase